MELVRDQSRPKDRCLAQINECVLTGGAHGTFKAAAVVGSKITNMAVKLIGSHEHIHELTTRLLWNPLVDWVRLPVSFFSVPCSQ
jgi:hypothetical protein